MSIPTITMQGASSSTIWVMVNIAQQLEPFECLNRTSILNVSGPEPPPCPSLVTASPMRPAAEVSNSSGRGGQSGRLSAVRADLRRPRWCRQAVPFCPRWLLPHRRSRRRPQSVLSALDARRPAGCALFPVPPSSEYAPARERDGDGATERRSDGARTPRWLRESGTSLLTTVPQAGVPSRRAR